MYVAVKGAKGDCQRPSAAGRSACGDRSVAELGCDQVAQQLGLAVDRVMTEGGIYDTQLAALAIKQASGDLVEAIFLLRAPRCRASRTAGAGNRGNAHRAPHLGSLQRSARWPCWARPMTTATACWILPCWPTAKRRPRA